MPPPLALFQFQNVGGGLDNCLFSHSPTAQVCPDLLGEHTTYPQTRSAALQAGDMLSEQDTLQQRAAAAQSTSVQLGISRCQLAESETKATEQGTRLEELEKRLETATKATRDHPSPCIPPHLSPSPSLLAGAHSSICCLFSSLWLPQ